MLQLAQHLSHHLDAVGTNGVLVHIAHSQVYDDYVCLWRMCICLWKGLIERVLLHSRERSSPRFVAGTSQSRSELASMSSFSEGQPASLTASTEQL